MKREKKHIKVKKVYESRGIVKFIITEQTHRESAFGESGGYPTPDVPSNAFVTKKRVELRSAAGPQMAGVPFSEGYLRLYVWGSVRRHDDTVLECSVSEFERILDAIREYNDFYFGFDANDIIPDRLFEI